MNAQTKTTTDAGIIVDESKIPLIRSLGLITAILMVAGLLSVQVCLKK